jgi:predicted nucleotidyltransferase
MCFAEVGFLIKHSLVSCGISCDIAVNDMARDKINVILGWHLLPFKKEYSSFKYIPYQLEQLSSAAWNAFSENAKKVLSHAFKVWDYSSENVRFLKERGLSALHLPVGYHQSLEQVPQGRPKDIDVLFFGSMGERRQKVLNILEREKKVRLHALFGVYGRERDEFIARSKIVLNVHFYPAKIFEAVRISYLLNNRCFIVSEESEINPYRGVTIPMFPYEQLPDACRSFLDKEHDIERESNAAHEEFRQKYPMTDLIKKVVG